MFIDGIIFVCEANEDKQNTKTLQAILGNFMNSFDLLSK